MDQELWAPFLANGPWAALAAFLLWSILSAWKEDRKEMNDMIPLLRDMQTANARVAAALERIEKRLEAAEKTATRRSGE